MRLATVAEAVDRLADEAPGADAAGVEYFPVSAATGEGVDALVEAVVARLPEGPAYYPEDMVTDTPEALLGGRPGARAAAGPGPGRAAPRHRLPGHRVGVAPDPLRDPGRARLAEGRS